jgi:hypothetical protein
MFDMLSHKLVFCNSFLHSHLPLSQRNNLVTKRSCNLLQCFASRLPISLMSEAEPAVAQNQITE